MQLQSLKKGFDWGLSVFSSSGGVGSCFSRKYDERKMGIWDLFP